MPPDDGGELIAARCGCGSGGQVARSLSRSALRAGSGSRDRELAADLVLQCVKEMSSCGARILWDPAYSWSMN